MTKLVQNWARNPATALTAAALALLVGLGAPPVARADDVVQAKGLMKAMSDYMAAQKAISFAYDVTLEVVTKEGQKIALVSSGAMVLNRPDKLRVARHGGFANVESTFDGKTLTLLGKEANAFVQIDAPGTIDNLVDLLRDKYDRPLPAADLLLSNIYEALMADVKEMRDLGSGVVGGVECDHLAFRSEEVDWQIWIAQGGRPYPCRYTITSKKVTGGPQYTIQIRDWKTGDAVAATQFGFANATNAKKLDVKDLPDIDDLPKIFKGDAK
jgi:hypothetical protein